MDKEQLRQLNILLAQSEKLSQESKQELKNLEALYLKTKSTIAAQCVQLNKASMSTVKNVSQLISAVRKNQLSKITEEKYHELQRQRTFNMHKLQKIMASLYWKNILTTLIVTFVVTSVISLYVDNVWPWQAHNQIVKQREAGKILLDAWPQLPHTDQEMIIQNA